MAFRSRRGGRRAPARARRSFRVGRRSMRGRRSGGAQTVRLVIQQGPAAPAFGGVVAQGHALHALTAPTPARKATF